MKEKFLVIFLIIATLTACNKNILDTENGQSADIVIHSYSLERDGYCLLVSGKIVNRGEIPAENIYMNFTVYDNTNTIIHTTSGYTAVGAVVPVNTFAHFEADFYDLPDWSSIKKIIYVIEWSNVGKEYSTGSNSGEIYLD